MTPKYYTPSIEEFHVGFEYEIKITIKKGLAFPKKPLKITSTEEFWQKNTFQKSIIEKTWNAMDLSTKNIEELLIINEIRVKHLDREDIEECGFIPISEGEKNKLNFITQDVYTHYITYKNQIAYLTFWDIENYHLNIHINCGDEEFKGTIKNKSELKKLMQQLGIN